MLLIGFLVSLYVAYAAFQRKSLTAGGALWAVIVGTLVFGLGGGVPGMALIGFFLTGTALSRYRREEKQQLSAGLLEKGDERDAIQVLANGGPAAVFCILHGLTGEPSFYVGALGSLAAAAADTWATEIGMLSPTQPRHLLTLRQVPAGTSGAVSESGLWGTLLGALFIGGLALLEPSDGALGRALVVTLGGLAGGLGDSLLGATLQERRQCLGCGAHTEQLRHACAPADREGMAGGDGETVCVGGISGLDNDAVNALATALGGSVAALLWTLFAAAAN